MSIINSALSFSNRKKGEYRPISVNPGILGMEHLNILFVRKQRLSKIVYDKKNCFELN